MPVSLRIPLLVLGVAVAAAGLISPDAAVALCYDGTMAFLLIAPLVLGGLGLLPSFFDNWGWRWRVLLGAAWGTGIVSTLVLLCGMASMLQRTLWIGVLVGLAAVGIVRIKPLFSVKPKGNEQAAPSTVDASHRLLLLLAPFAALMVVAASNAPGTIWMEEGNGYDVLEYHLQVPREYYETGRIEYLPHNVYANFPSGMEMLYLLGMIVFDDVYTGAAVANYLHAAFGILSLFAVWTVARDWSRHAGVMACVALGTVNWIWYFAGLAYVELLMVFYGVVATGLLLRTMDRGMCRWSGLALGVAAGLCCGTKYTAVPMVALPLVLGFVLFPLFHRIQRDGESADASSGGSGKPFVPAFLMLGLGLILAVSPWAVRNFAWTGDPVFPLGESLIAARPDGWTDASAAAWREGHTASADERSPAGRIRSLWARVPGDHMQRFGPALFLIALGGLIGRRIRREDAVLLLLLLAQVLVWLFATHLYARFSVVFLIPLALLCGRAATCEIRTWRNVQIAVLLVGVTWNLVYASATFQRESPWGLHPSVLTKVGTYGIVNNELPANASLLLVGESTALYYDRSVDYHVVFNEQPLAERLSMSDGDRRAMEWMAAQGYTHILVNWFEIARLSRTYGMPAVLNRETFDRLCRLDQPPRLTVRNEIPLDDSDRVYQTLYALESSPLRAP